MTTSPPSPTRGGRIEIDQGISGGDGFDDILLGASRGGDIILGDDIYGGDDTDDIFAFADRGGLIRGEDIWGGSGDDHIHARRDPRRHRRLRRSLRWQRP